MHDRVYFKYICNTQYTNIGTIDRDTRMTPETPTTTPMTPEKPTVAFKDTKNDIRDQS